MDTLSREEVTEWLACLGDMPLGDKSSQHREAAGEPGSILLTYMEPKKAGGPRKVICSIGLSKPMESPSEASSQLSLELVSTDDPPQVYSKPGAGTISRDNRKVRFELTLRKPPEGNFCFRLFTAELESTDE